MEILKFIFVLGINFSIFGFIWGIFMFLLRALQPPAQQRNEGVSYVLRIIKYFLLVSVTANYIAVYEMGEPGARVSTMNIVLGSIVLGLYLLGKLQNRTIMNQIAKNPLISQFLPKIDPKVERFLLIGSLLYFIACLLYPIMVDNAVINWFTETIIGIYETPVIGWIFSVIAFFFLISIIMRGANVIGKILNGESITDNPNVGGSVHFRSERRDFRETTEEHEDEEGFVDYEDVTEEEEEDSAKTSSDEGK
ncbi:MAG: hypothetical protein WDZ35_06635 [Crocinitomicaceae bacterium]